MKPKDRVETSDGLIVGPQKVYAIYINTNNFSGGLLVEKDGTLSLEIQQGKIEDGARHLFDVIMRFARQTTELREAQASAINESLLNAAKALDFRGFFRNHSCADKETKLDMAAMRDAIAAAEAHKGAA